MHRPVQAQAGGISSGGGFGSIEFDGVIVKLGPTGTFVYSTYFDLFVLIANPTDTAADVRATYLLPDGTTVEKPYTVQSRSRFNIWADLEDARLANTAVSTTIRSSNERCGGLGDGEAGGSSNTQTYILIANTSPTAGGTRDPALVRISPTGPAGVARGRQAGRRLDELDVSDERIPDDERGEPAEVSVVRPELANPVGETQRGNARVVHQRARNPSGRQGLSEHVPVRLVLREWHQRRRLQPGADLIEGHGERCRGPVDARMRDDRQKLVKAGPWDGPRGSPLGKTGHRLERCGVPSGILAMGVNEDVRVDGNHEPRSR